MKHNWLFWLPRALVILFALFTALFSFDSFAGNAPWYRIATDVLVHNIPLFVLLLFLWISWKRPALGSILFLTVALGMAFLVRSNGYFWATLIFAIPPLIVAALFFFEYRRSKSSARVQRG